MIAFAAAQTAASGAGEWPHLVNVPRDARRPVAERIPHSTVRHPLVKGTQRLPRGSRPGRSRVVAIL